MNFYELNSLYSAIEHNGNWMNLDVLIAKKNKVPKKCKFKVSEEIIIPLTESSIKYETHKGGVKSDKAYASSHHRKLIFISGFLVQCSTPQKVSTILYLTNNCSVFDCSANLVRLSML